MVKCFNQNFKSWILGEKRVKKSYLYICYYTFGCFCLCYYQIVSFCTNLSGLSFFILLQVRKLFCRWSENVEIKISYVCTHGKGFCSSNAMVMYHLTGHFETNPLISRYELCLGSIKIHLSYCPVNHLAPTDYVLVMSFRPRVPPSLPPHPSTNRFGCSRTAE